MTGKEELELLENFEVKREFWKSDKYEINSQSIKYVFYFLI